MAYVLFTSGSTGEPKGVPIRHRNFDQYLTHCIDRYAVGPGARFAPAFELTFDGSVFGMFVTWYSGATLVVPRPEDVLAPARFVTERGVTHWFSVPSVVSMAHRQGMLPAASMPGLRWSLFGGEQLTLDHARAWTTAAPGSVIENLYGPTEVTISCTGEIESVLRSHPAVVGAVVLAVPGAADGPTLHAVYTGEPVDPAELTAVAAEQLPPSGCRPTCGPPDTGAWTSSRSTPTARSTGAAWPTS